MPWRNCSGFMSTSDSQGSASVTLVMPALLTATSTGPSRSCTSSTAAAAWSGTVRSATMPSEPFPSSAARSRMRSEVASTATRCTHPA